MRLWYRPQEHRPPQLGADRKIIPPPPSVQRIAFGGRVHFEGDLGLLAPPPDPRYEPPPESKRDR
jgi:hypothetical protein